MSLLKLSCFVACTLAALGHSNAQACWWWGSNYSAGYSPYYAGYAPTSGYYGAGYGYSTTSFYSPYGMMSPYSYGSYYGGSYGYGSGSGCCNTCDPCGCSSGNCATGNCGVTTGKPSEPVPDNPPRIPADPMPTYDPMDTQDGVPMDDPNFRKTDPDSSASPETGDRTDAFKIPSSGESNGDLPSGEKNPAVDPLKGAETLKDKATDDAIKAPRPGANIVPTLIDPRNSARVIPTLDLDHKLTWRSAPVIARPVAAVPTSRPLIVRKAVRVVPGADSAPQGLPIVRN